MKKALKITAIVLGLFFLLLITAALTLPHLISLDRYKGMIEAKLEQVLQREVTLGGVQITILPVLGATIEDFVISNPPTFSTTPFLSLKVLRVRVKLLPLLLGKKEIGGVTLQRPVIFVERDKKGRLNMPLMDEKVKKGRRRQLKSGRVKVGDTLAFTALGAGLTWASAVVRIV